RISVTESEVAKVEALIRRIVSPNDLDVILSNIGVTPGFSSIYTSNSAAHTAFAQVSLKDGHKVGSYEYMARIRQRIAEEMPELNTYFQSGGMVDAVLNLGLAAPIDVQVGGSNLERSHETAVELASEVQRIPGVADVYIPQDVDYPALKLDINRTRAGELGLDQQEVVGNLITALTSNQMIAPSYWVDPRSGQDYMLTVQYSEGQIKSLADLRAIPVRAPFCSFAIGLTLSVVLLYLILVAQFRSFIDPLLILLAVPPGLTGVLVTLWFTGTTLNVMSLMGVVMLTGIAVSNSILIVEF